MAEMDWEKVKKVVRLWSLRPWLYSWDIALHRDADKKVDNRWIRWFEDMSLVKKDNRASAHAELDDAELAMVESVYKVYELVFENEKSFYRNIGDEDEIMMLIYKQSAFGDWRTPLMSEATNITAIRVWQDKLPEQDDKHLLLLIFVCYNYCTLSRLIRCMDGGLKSVLDMMFTEKVNVQEIREAGNEAFTSGNYKLANEKYTAALRIQTYSHKLYSNRAQVHLKNDNARAAVCDGLRCIRIEPKWDKGWHRYAQGLYRLNQVIPAWLANIEARSTFSRHVEPLEEQADFFMQNMEVIQYEEEFERSKRKQRQDAAKQTTLGYSQDDLPELVSDAEESEPVSPQVTPTKKPASKKLNTDKKSNKNHSKGRKSDKENQMKNKKAPNRNNNNNSQAQPDEVTVERPVNLHVVRTQELLNQATVALLEMRMRNALVAYTEALVLLDAATQKEMDYYDEQLAVVLYAQGISSINIGGEKEVEDGLHFFESILTRFQHLVFPLAYLGIGLAYYKWNRFQKAIDPLTTGLRITQKHVLPKDYKWPESEVTIEESKKDKLLERLEQLLMECRVPVAPLAKCRYNECGHYKVELYLTDPDFRGFVEMTCLAHCRVAYHLDCWKKAKTASNKEILSGPCFTPNCRNPLRYILTYDHNGDVADRKINPIQIKEACIKKPSMKMPATSQYTLMRKRERKQRRKQKREEERQRSSEAAMVETLVAEVEQAAGSTTHAEHVQAPSVDLRSCTKIMPKREEEAKEEENKKLKKKRRQNKAVVRLDLVPPESLQGAAAAAPSSNCNSPLPGSFGGLDDFDDLAGYQCDDPFAVPAHLAADVARFQEMTSDSRKSSVSLTSRSPSPSVSEATEREKEIDEANNRLAIRESLFQLFKGILQESGPLHIDDPKIQSQLADFPPDTINIIENEGGLSSLLKKSINFTLIDDFVGLLKDSNKIRKAANKRKAQLRKLTGKKGALDAIPPRIKSCLAVPGTSGGSELSGRSPTGLDTESDRESVASTDTGCSESIEITSNSSRSSSLRNKPPSLASSVVSSKSSPWQRQLSDHHDELQYTEIETRSADMVLHGDSPSPPVSKVNSSEVVNQYRLGANRLLAAVELGKLAFRVNLRLGVEVRFRYGWKLMAGLEKVDVETSTEAAGILELAIKSVTTSSTMVYNVDGAEVYFFGLGENSVRGERAQWVTGPEVGYNHGIVIALALDHVDMRTVRLESVDHTAGEALQAVKTAADTVRAVSDRFKASFDIKQAVMPIFFAMGRRVARDDPETLVLLSKSNPLPKPPPGLGLNTSALTGITPLSSHTAPIARPASQSNSPIHKRATPSPIANPLLNNIILPTTDTPLNYNSTVAQPALNKSTIANMLSSSAPLSTFNSTVTPSLVFGTSTSQLTVNGTAAQPTFSSTAGQSAINSVTVRYSPYAAQSAFDTAATTSAFNSSTAQSRLHTLGGEAPFSTSSAPPGLASFDISTSCSPYGASAAFSSLAATPAFGTSAASSAFSSSGVTTDFSTSTAQSSFPPSIWGNSLVDNSAERFSSSKLYGFNDPLTAAAKEREQNEVALQAAKTQAKEYHQVIEKLQLQMSEVQEQLGSVTRDFTAQKLRVAAEQEQNKVMLGKVKEMAERDTLQQGQLQQVTTERELLRQQMEQLRRSSEEAMAEANSKTQRERNLRLATDSHYEELTGVLEKTEAKHRDEKRRAENAEVALLQLKLEVGLQIIDRSIKEAEIVISKIRAEASQYRDQFVPVPTEYLAAEEAWKSTLSQIRSTRERAVAAFEDQKTRVMSGQRLETLPTLDIPRPPPAPETPQLQKPMSYHHMHRHQGAAVGSDSMSNGRATPPAACRSPGPGLPAAARPQPAAARPQPAAARPPPAAARPLTAAAALLSGAAMLANKTPAPAPAPAPAAARPSGFGAVAAAGKVTNKSKNSFDRIVEGIQEDYPTFDRTKISYVLKKLRESRNGSLSGMKMEDVLAGVEAYIRQEQQSVSRAPSMDMLDPVSPKTSMEQDPCTICLEELLGTNTQKLDCHHRFHTKCIRMWLKEKSTCPNCNKHALLADDFPALC